MLAPGDARNERSWKRGPGEHGVVKSLKRGSAGAGVSGLLRALLRLLHRLVDLLSRPFLGLLARFDFLLLDRGARCRRRGGFNTAPSECGNGETNKKPSHGNISQR